MGRQSLGRGSSGMQDKEDRISVSKRAPLVSSASAFPHSRGRAFHRIPDEDEEANDEIEDLISTHFIEGQLEDPTPTLSDEEWNELKTWCDDKRAKSTTTVIGGASVPAGFSRGPISALPKTKTLPSAGLELWRSLGGKKTLTSKELSNYQTFSISKEEPAPYKVRNLSARNFPYAPGTLAAKAFSILLRHKRPLHISELLQKLTSERAFHTVHHRYSELSRALRQHSILFEKTTKATYTVRLGFRKLQKPETIKVVLPIDRGGEITSLLDLVVSLTRECTTPMGVYPGLIFNLLRSMEIQCSYDGVRRVMQTNQFERNGTWYKLVEQ
jgi:hypothetical protein